METHFLADTPTTNPLNEFITNMSSLVTAAMDWMSSAWETISGDPVLMTIVIGLPLVGLGIGLLGRLIRVG